ncbi:MAG: hypothetical protein V5A30_09000 [Haloarculaceae archaeon]
MAAPDDGEEWRFSLEDLEDEEAASDGDAASDDVTDERGAADEDEAGGNVAGTLRPERPVTPGNINPENAFFVLVGALIAGLFVGAVLSLAL